MSWNPEKRLENVHRLAHIAHQLRSAEAEARDMLGAAIRSAAALDVPPSAIAKAANLSPGRVTQILSEDASTDPEPGEITRTVPEWDGWIYDRLIAHQPRFEGVIMPPDQWRRRKRAD